MFKFDAKRVIILPMKESHLLNIVIAEEQEADIEDIHKVNVAAFKGGGEADVVDQLRESCDEFISLVAKVNGKVVGHILFTPVRIIQIDDWSVSGMGLAPLAVLPEYQGEGIGSSLCRQGLKRIEAAGHSFVVVLGDPRYYSRFGFGRASKHGIASSFEGVPDEAFMITIFDSNVMADVSGIAYYQPEFNAVT